MIKSLKQYIAEAEQITIEPARQNTQVIRQGTKTVGTVTNPALAATIKSAIGKGEMSLAGTEIKEEEIDEKWAGDAKVEPTGQYADKNIEELKSMLAKLKKSGPHKEGSPGFKKMRQIMFAIRAKKGWKGGVNEAEVDESGLQAYLGNKKYGKEGMDALRKAGREGASKETMAKIRAKYDKLDEVQVDEKAKNPYAIGMAAAKKAAGIKKKHATNLPKSVVVKGHEIAKKIKKQENTNEAERPSDQADFGAGLGAGRSDKVLEGNKLKNLKSDSKKQKVKESMNTLEAAYHEGKSHGLTKHGYACRYDEGSDEHRRYHEGFKEGLDECYGLMPNRGLIVSEEPAATVPGMAQQAMPAMEADLDEMNKTEYMRHKAKTTPGDTFKAFGQTMHDKDVLEADMFAFESLNKQLNDLLNESTEVVNEGISVSMSQGLGGTGAEDSVSVTAQGDDAAKLLAFIKQVGLGGLGADKTDVKTLAEPAIAVVSDYGAPKFAGHDDMKSLMSKVTGDYKDEDDHAHDHPEAAVCNECGMTETKCGCDEAKFMDETQTQDQLTDTVAEDDGEGDIAAYGQEAEINASMPAKGGAGMNEGGDGMEDSKDAADGVKVGAEAEEAEQEMSEAAEDNPKVKDEEELTEWANDAGKDGTEQSFERDIEFMTKVIAGGLNKPKATGQTTIPVIAGQDARTGDEDVNAWKRLAGIFK